MQVPGATHILLGRFVVIDIGVVGKVFDGVGVVVSVVLFAVVNWTLYRIG